MEFISGTILEIHSGWYIPDTYSYSIRRAAANAGIVNYFKTYGKSKGYSKVEVGKVCNQYRPNLSTTSEGLLAYFENQEKFKRNRRSVAKPGKFFKKFFPNATDPEVEDFVNYFKNEVMGENPTVNYHIGKTEEDFVHAYTKIRKSNSGIYEFNGPGQGFKSISDSCMRYTASGMNLHTHPVCAYASGDFEIHYLTDDTGKTLARSTVFAKKNADGVYTVFSPGPIYCCSVASGKKLRGILNEHLGWDEDKVWNSSIQNWTGAKFKPIAYHKNDTRYTTKSGKVYSSCECFILPYLDYGGGISKVINKDNQVEYLVYIKSYGDCAGAAGYGYIYNNVYEDDKGSIVNKYGDIVGN